MHACNTCVAFVWVHIWGWPWTPMSWGFICEFIYWLCICGFKFVFLALFIYWTNCCCQIATWSREKSTRLSPLGAYSQDRGKRMNRATRIQRDKSVKHSVVSEFTSVNTWVHVRMCKRCKMVCVWEITEVCPMAEGNCGHWNPLWRS